MQEAIIVAWQQFRDIKIQFFFLLLLLSDYYYPSFLHKLMKKNLEQYKNLKKFFK